jgi:uncharacterized membrane protein
MNPILLIAVVVLIVFISLLLWLGRRVARLETALEELRDAAAVQKAAQERAAPTSINGAEAAAPQTPMAAPPPAPSIPAPPPATPQSAQPPAWQPPRIPPDDAPHYRVEEPAAAHAARKASAIESIRGRFGLAGVEWEAIIGGSWLNKLGVLVFVIGLALFVGYSLTELGPLGRVTVGAAVSLAMLIGGVMLERRPLYKLYARGLIGGGWSGLYFAAYASHGIAAAQVIVNPALATGLLIAVAAGMILHSLRYRSEVVTGLAYFGAFAAVSLSAPSDFAALALIPLAASLLYVAQRFGWYRITIAGLAVTYGAYLFVIAGGPVSTAQVVRNESVVAIYWLLFELFDLVDTARGRPGRVVRVEYYPVTLFPLNTCAFIGVSILQWLRFPQLRLDILLACIAGVFLLDAAGRAMIRPPGSFKPEQDAPQRAAEGGYEGAVTVAAVLAAVAIFQRFSGLEIEVVLLLEAQMLILAGMGLREKYLQRLGGLIFIAPAAKLLLFDSLIAGGLGSVSLLGLELRRWSLLAGVTAAIGYLNSFLIGERYAEGFSYFASLVAAVVIMVEWRIEFLGPGWLILGACLFETGLRITVMGLRVQGYLVAALGALTMVFLALVRWPPVAVSSLQIALVLAAAITYGITFETSLDARSLSDAERLAVRDVSLYGANVFVVLLLWYLLPAPLVAVSWMLLALVLVEGGLSIPLTPARRCGYAIAALAYGRVFPVNFTDTVLTAGLSSPLITVAPIALGFYWVAARLRSEGAQKQLERGEEYLWRICLYGASLLVVVLIRFEAGHAYAVVGWSLMMLVLLYLGIARADRDLRLQAYLVAMLIFWRGCATNFYLPGTLEGVIAMRVATDAIAIAALYAAEFMSPRKVEDGEQPGVTGVERALVTVERNARLMFALLATALLTLLLYNEVSGQMLTEVWALEGASLLVLGFVERERVLRYCALALLGVCMLKVFFYDLRNLETMARILSFIVLGLLMLAVSFIYTRYYDRLRRYL